MAESSWRTGSCRHQWSVLQHNHDSRLPRSSDPREPVPVPAHHFWLHWSVCGALALVACTLLALGLSASAVAPGRARILTSWSTERFIPPTGCGRDETVTQSTRFETADVKTLDDFLTLGRLPRTLLTHADLDLCPNITEPASDDLLRIPKEVKMLMLIGTQKTGSTWLFQALLKNDQFVPTLRRPGEARELNLTKLGQNLLAKEPQYFNRWPLPPVQVYLHAWPPSIIGKMLSGDAGAKVLLDASPQYLMNALAPARIRAVAPHAKFITIVRDGPMRTLSDYTMMSRVDCVNNPSRLCPLPTFLEQVQYELNDPKWRPECYFNSTGSSATWWDCHRCHFGYINRTTAAAECERAGAVGPPDFGSCAEPAHRFLDHGQYAAQLAWWLRFFPPEQFLVISSGRLRDPEARVQVLNDILAFAGVSQEAQFTEAMLADVKGFNAAGHEHTAGEREGLAQLRVFFRKPQQDLARLVDTFWPGSGFEIHYES